MEQAQGSKIFSEGQIVATFEIPENIRENILQKKSWGAEILTAHAQKFFGEEAKWLLEESESTTRLTGTKSVHTRNDKQITFMLVEKKGEPSIHITKLVEDLNEGNLREVFAYQVREEKRSKSGLGSAFAALQAMDTSALPENHEIVDLQVQTDTTRGGLQFAPQYMNEDPHADGLSSMRFFRSVREIALNRNKKYRAKITKITKSGRKNKKGAIMLNINVKVFESY